VAYISTDLVSPVRYNPGETLEFELSFTAPEAGNYYLLGALYDSGYNYISGSMFGVLLSEDKTYMFNSSEQTKPWELGEGDTMTLSSKFSFARSDAIMGLFLMKMAGNAPSLDDDEVKGSTMVSLEAVRLMELDLTALMSLVVVAGMAGVMVKIAK